MTLLAPHAKIIADSAISPEVAAARGYRSVEDPAELERLGFADYQQRVPALLIPIHSVAGKVALHHLRPDVPRTAKKGKPIKYETPADARMILDVPPSVRSKIGDPSVPLWLTEGSRKADAAATKGLACVALLGVWNFRGKNAQGGSTILGDFEAIALKGREVFVAFDSDAATKPAVQGALRRLRGFLESRGARVRVVALPEGENGAKVGLDDFFAAGHSLDELRALASVEVLQSKIEGSDGKPTIDVSPEIKKKVDEAEDALLASKVDVFHRGGELVRLGRRDGRVVVDPLPQPSLTELLSDVAVWRGKNRNGDLARVRPPRDVVEALAARGAWKLREIVDVVERPTLRPDGTVLETPGYDPGSRIYVEPSAAFPRVNESPRFTDALAALGALRECFCDFPFASPADRSGALALVLTLLGRHAIAGPTPLFAIRAHERGEGKSLVVDVASVIATGAEVSRTTQASTSDEERKEILAHGREGVPLILIDNVDRPLGSDVLAAALTARTYRGRLLGQNRMIEVPVPVFAATGLNLEVRGDLGRRVIPIEIASNTERPEERTGFRHPDLIAWVRVERPRLVAAGLTVLRWFFAEGRPAIDMKTFGSFEAWSGLVRSVLVWLGEHDPCDARERFRAEGDPAFEALGVVLETWSRVLGGSAYAVSEVVAAAGRDRELRDALAALDGKLDPEKLDQRRLGYALRRFRGRIVNGQKFESDQKGKRGVPWKVVTMARGSSPSSPIVTAIVTTETESREDVPSKGDDGDDVSSTFSARARARAHAREHAGSGLERSSPSSHRHPPDFTFDPDAPREDGRLFDTDELAGGDRT